MSAKYNLYSKTSFGYSVQRLEWDDEAKHWIVTIKNNTGNVFRRNFDIVYVDNFKIQLVPLHTRIFIFFVYNAGFQQQGRSEFPKFQKNLKISRGPYCILHNGIIRLI